LGAAALWLGLTMPAAAAEPDERALLTTFRREFVELTPGQGDFPGEFQMGHDGGEAAEAPRHRVTLNDSFAVARYEVPQNLWQAVMGANPSRWKGPRNAVEMLTYDEAVEFCRKATERMRALGLITTRQVVRLPSEAEWEYAARGSDGRTYPWGESINQSRANYNGKDTDAVGSHESGKSPFGLYDMAGNVWEWVNDWYDGAYYQSSPPSNPPGPSTGQYRVLRGGSWANVDGDNMRAADRLSFNPSDVFTDVGFRCARSLP
jgi:formylglycine-generating enzyme required for sulfatase activity